MGARHLLRFRAVNRDTFEAIRRGRKTIETRAATPRYRRIESGDTLKLVCGRSVCWKRVERIRRFRSISAILRTYHRNKIMPGVTSRKEFRESYYRYPGYREKLKRHGLIAMELAKNGR